MTNLLVAANVAAASDLTQEQYTRTLEDKLTERDSIIASLKARIEMDESVKEWLNEDVADAEEQVNQLLQVNEQYQLNLMAADNEVRDLQLARAASDAYVAAMLLRLSKIGNP